MPLIVRWPGVVQPGTTCDVPVMSIDYFPTILTIAGVPLPTDRAIDGVSLVPILSGQGQLAPRSLFWHFPHYRAAPAPYSIIRKGDWKLIREYESGKRELYNLADDLGETTDLAPTMPDKVAELDAELSAHLESVGAKLPKPNPDYRPKAPANSAKKRSPK